MAASKIALTPSNHPTAATVLATGPTLQTPCVYCGTQYRSDPCGSVHANVRRVLRRASGARSRKGGR